MAIRTITQFKALYGNSGTVFPDNTTGDISEGDVRAFGEDIADSFLNSSSTFQSLTTATGTDTYAVTGYITAYAAGFSIYVLFTNANSTVATLNVNSLGAKAIKKNGTTALEAGDIPAGSVKLLIYDGTNFQLIHPSVIDGGTP
jgi:hypothetical protein